jgi:hypothetical protein
MALAGALAVSSNLVGGFSNRTIRPLIGGLLGEPYNQARCCYDLRRLKLKGLIRKVAHTNIYVLTADGQRFAIFYTKVGAGSCAHCSPRIRSPHHSPSGRACEPSIGPSPTTSPTPTGPPENSAQLSMP